MTDSQRDDPVLITDAARSYEEDLAVRKRRYKLAMGMRIPLMIAAAFCYSIPWLAVSLLVISIPLPWMAVLIANDRLPIKREDTSRFTPERAALESRSQPLTAARGEVVDGLVIEGETAEQSDARHAEELRGDHTRNSAGEG